MGQETCSHAIQATPLEDHSPTKVATSIQAEACPEDYVSSSPRPTIPKTQSRFEEVQVERKVLDTLGRKWNNLEDDPIMEVEAKRLACGLCRNQMEPRNRGLC